MDALLTRRLDRLRSFGRPIDQAGGLPSARAPDHAGPLAESLGGIESRGEHGAIVLVETTTALPMDVQRLAALPYSIDVNAPLVCFDVETTGLATASGTLAFLVGIGIWHAGVMRVTQMLLPDHSAERSMLSVLSTLLPADGWLVTYNGKCFDWPLITARYRLHRRDPPVLAGHLDLLPVARQLWKHRLGGARLALVEQALCGVERTHDLPGYEVPERYFSYLRSRRADLLLDVVEHNRQDIVSLGRLLCVLAEGFASPRSWPVAHPGDLFGLARAYARRSRHAEALSVVEAGLAADAWSRGVEGGAGLHRRLSAERARLLARLGRREEAYQAWLQIAARGGPGAGVAWLHVARYREHVERDAAAAIYACQQAGTIAERARAWGEPMFFVERDLERRLPRLRRLSFRRRPLSRGYGRAA